MKYLNFTVQAARIEAFRGRIAGHRARMVEAGIPVEGFDAAAKEALDAINAVCSERLTKGGRRKVSDANLRTILSLIDVYFLVSEDMRGRLNHYDHYAALKVEHDFFAAQMKPQSLVVAPGYVSAPGSILQRLVDHAAQPHLARDESAIAFEKLFAAINRGDVGEAYDLQAPAQKFTSNEKQVSNKYRTCHLLDAPAA